LVPWFIPGDKAAGKWSWPRLCTQCGGKEWVKLFLHFHYIFAHGLYRHNFIFTFPALYRSQLQISKLNSLSFRFPDK